MVSFLVFSSCLFAEVGLEVRNKSYFSDRDFKRIPEFFTAKNMQVGKYIAGPPKAKDRVLFVVKVTGSSNDISQNVLWKVDFVTSVNPAPQTIKIPIDNPKIFGKEVFIGLTGNDWPDQSVQLLAWRLCLLNTEGSIIAKKQSFLWSK